MPFLHTNGIRLAYERAGRGEPVLMIMGSGAAGRVWTTHQTPALHRAGYETIVFDSRGIPPSDAPEGKYSLADLVADTRGLIEALGLAPCRIVGTSLGASVAQELAIEFPGLVRCAVLIAAAARTDTARRAQLLAGRALAESGVRLPREYAAARSVFEMLSPATLNDDAAVSLWLDVFELAGDGAAEGQIWIDDAADRREALRTVAAPCRVIAYSDDLVTPPHLGAEIAEAIPDCDYVEIPHCGHLGHLERPDAVNPVITDFLDGH
jgi:pimeloyl-ACP methyl ester carboxylesterase